MLDLGRTFLYVTEREPSATAIIDGDLTLTCAAWLDRTLRMVAGLDAIGLHRGDRLVTSLRNRIEAATLHWACQLAGVVITPVTGARRPRSSTMCSAMPAHGRCASSRFPRMRSRTRPAPATFPGSRRTAPPAAPWHSTTFPLRTGGRGSAGGTGRRLRDALHLRHHGTPEGGTREPMPPSAPPPSPTSRRTATATANAPSG